MTLQQNLRRSWRMVTMWIAGGAVCFGALPPEQQAAILSKVGITQADLPFWLGLIFMAARMLPQKSVTKED